MLDAVASLLVDLSEQKIYATMESGKVEVINVSTGKAATPTPLMTDTIATKYELTDLIGRNYSWRIPDVPHVMCFQNNPMYCIHPRTSGAPIGVPGYQATCSKCGWKGPANQFPQLLTVPICKTCWLKTHSKTKQ
jgi:hypothetical protein